MGCGKSKIKRISLTPDNIDESVIENGIGTISGKVNGEINRPKSGSVELEHNGHIPGETRNEEDEATTILPNRLLLSAIPVSDLGDSLDSRHLSESLNMSQSLGGGFLKHHLSNGNTNGIGGNNHNSGDSGSGGADSGYDEYDEEYSHIITENSPKEIVAKIESDFQPADLPELLVITGRACARILSGYQKNKLEEGKILDALREEGLLAKPKGKTAGGMSFEVVDASIAQGRTSRNNSSAVSARRSEHHSTSNDDSFVSSAFIPRKTLAKLENRRVTIRRPSIQIDKKLAIAEERRKAAEEEKVKTVLERSGLERHGRMKSASAYERQKQYSATVAKRQQQLKEIRDRLKDKHRKNDMVRLKKQLEHSDSPTRTTLISGTSSLAESSADINADNNNLISKMAPPIAAAVGGGSGASNGFFDD